ncbi:response regulator [Lacibacter sp. H375]|uniref:response regulator n=1 Tax=Lacibacter sp. H375 TaxID=3133424 RepID=UPI0030C246C2
MNDQVKHILLIDDDVINNFLSREIISMYLPNAIIDAFTNPYEALRYIENKLNQKQSLPDIILLDINMPLMDGWEFLKKIDQLEQRNHFHTNVYLYTSSVYHEDRLKAKKLSYCEKRISQTSHKRSHPGNAGRLTFRFNLLFLHFACQKQPFAFISFYFFFVCCTFTLLI